MPDLQTFNRIPVLDNLRTIHKKRDKKGRGV